MEWEKAFSVSQGGNDAGRRFLCARKRCEGIRFVGESLMDFENESEDSPAEFLADLAKQLCANEGVDICLADILRVHFLQESPSPDAVALAKAAIVKLAGERANLAGAECADD
jgi:hypothetical protein